MKLSWIDHLFICFCLGFFFVTQRNLTLTGESWSILVHLEIAYNEGEKGQPGYFSLYCTHYIQVSFTASFWSLPPPPVRCWQRNREVNDGGLHGWKRHRKKTHVINSVFNTASHFQFQIAFSALKTLSFWFSWFSTCVAAPHAKTGPHKFRSGSGRGWQGQCRQRVVWNLSVFQCLEYFWNVLVPWC